MPRLAHQRLRQQGLIESAFQTPAEIVAALGVVQAQDYPAALWALGLRLPGTTAQSVEQAITERAIVRTWLMRGTLHFVTPGDVRWMLDLFAPGILAGSARRHRELRLDEATLERSSRLIADAVQGGQTRTRSELFALLDAHRLDTPNQRGVYMLSRASYEGIIGQGVQTGRDPSFFALDTLPPARHLGREEAITELARRYFTGHGPATLQDFVWWSGLRVTEARAGLEAVQAELVADGVDGQTLWRANVDAPDAPPASAAFLLPAYDEFLIGYKDRRASLAPEHAALVKNANGLGATVVWDGRVIGTWTRETKRDEVIIHARPFEDWPDEARQAVDQATEQYGAFHTKHAVLRLNESYEDPPSAGYSSTRSRKSR